jgi:hypothetical protein
MEMRIFEVAGETFTRFKVPKSEFPIVKRLLTAHGITTPTKKNSRFVYFEAKGDYLNGEKGAGAGE